MKVLAMTVCCVDLYPQTGKVYVGGNSLNFASQAIKSGAQEVAVLGAVGDDEYGKLVKDYLLSKSIDSSHLHTERGKTASNKIYINEHNDRYFLPDSWDGGVYASYRLTANDIAYMESFDLIATTYHDPSIQVILDNKRNSRLVLDYLDSCDLEFLEKTLPETDISFLSGHESLVEQLKTQSIKYPSPIVVTLGANGSVTLLNGVAYHMPAEPVERVVDTTGCGDAYQAAFSLSWFLEGDVKKAMKLGSLAASKVLGHIGGVA